MKDEPQPPDVEKSVAEKCAEALTPAVMVRDAAHQREVMENYMKSAIAVEPGWPRNT